MFLCWFHFLSSSVYLNNTRSNAFFKKNFHLAFLKCFGKARLRVSLFAVKQPQSFSVSWQMCSTWSCVQHARSQASEGWIGFCGRHFWLKSSNTQPLQWLVVIPAPATETEWEFFFIFLFFMMWFTFLGSSRKFSLYSHTPRDCHHLVLCKCLN